MENGGPEARVILPSTCADRRRIVRAGVLRPRCAADSATAPAAASSGAYPSDPPVCAA